jgi:glycerol-3-phosphate acyltransferase PlsY
MGMTDIYSMFLIACAYLIGSIPSGYVIAYFNGIQDIREHGSGNIGATNVARQLGWPYFFVVFFCDFFKAYSYLLFLLWFGYDAEFLFIAATALLVGNALPLFLSFKGGKGIATGVGVLTVIHPALLIYAFGTWMLTFAITRTIGIASVMGLITLPITSAFILQDPSVMTLFMILLACWGLYLHRTNIARYFAFT